MTKRMSRRTLAQLVLGATGAAAVAALTRTEGWAAQVLDRLSSAPSSGGLRDYWPTQGWRTAQPEAVGMDATMVDELRAFGDDPESNLNGIMVIKHGYVVTE